MRETDDIGDHADVQRARETGEEVFVHRGVGGEEVGRGGVRAEEFGQDGGYGYFRMNMG